MTLEHLFKNTLVAGLLTVPVLTADAQIGINTTGAAPNKAAMLDLSDLSRGLLAPRMLRAERIAIPAAVPNSLLVYQTDDFGTAGTSELKGFWYYDTPAAAWRRVGSTGPAWQLGGNTGTNPASDYIGTSDAQDLSFRVNTAERARLMGVAGSNQGFLNVGVSPGAAWTISPQERVEVAGATRVIGAAAAPNAGDIQWNAAKNVHEGYTDNVAPSASGWYQLENVFGTRIQEQYIGSSSATCQYPTTNTSVTTGPRTWPIIDDASFPNANSVGTLETPYSLFWEDGRHQFLYRAIDFANLSICPFTDITHIAFNCTNGVGQQVRNGRVNTANTVTAALSTFYLIGLQNNANLAPFNPVTGWNIHAMTTPIQWQGGSFNMVVEFCFDNQDWTTNAGVQSENTSFLSNYSLYCDACGAPGGGSFCGYVACGNPPTGPASTSTGTLCTGWGWSNGANGLQSAGGCEWNAATSLRTCDGTFQYIGAQGAFSKRPLLALFAQNTGGAPALPRSNYIVAQDGVMIGSAAWATAGAFPSQNFKGPGTISAEKGVFASGILLSDHVFDSYFDGQVKPEDAAEGKQYQHMPIGEMRNYVERERHLPTMDGRAKWNSEGQFSVDQVTNQMWVTVEAQALYIKELNERMNALQQYLVEKRLKEIGR